MCERLILDPFPFFQVCISIHEMSSYSNFMEYDSGM